MKMLALVIGILAVVAFGFSLVEVGGAGDVRASTRIEASAASSEGFAQAIAPFAWQFPRDFGAHPEFQTEWWYYTGNLTAESGERFGFQFTIFRRAITPERAASASEWRDNQLYMAHFTISDIAGGKFYHDERFSRSGAGLAGAQGEPHYRVWLEDWQVVALDDAAQRTRLRAQNAVMGLDVTFVQVKPPALQGDNGLSPKSAEVGNASYYYSLSRLLTEGTLTLNGKTYAVSGLTWRDHEFSTSALGDGAQGWDWFGLIFDDGSELMLGKIRLQDGGREMAFGGMYIFPDGSTRYLPAETFTITPTRTWQSPHTGALYPAGWDVRIAAGDLQLAFAVTPLMADQELHGTNVSYWEGAVSVSGDVTGVGYAELTGYVETMEGRF